MIGPSIDIGRNSFFLQAPGLGQKGIDVPADAIGSQGPYNTGDPGGSQGRQGNFRSPSGEASLSAPSQDVDMAVNKARC